MAYFYLAPNHNYTLKMTHYTERTVLPFAAIVGQEKLKKALILNAINLNLHGVLIKGEKGTAKSTAVRALADLLPEIDVVKNCPFNCSPTEPSLQCDNCNEKYSNGIQLNVEKRKTKVVDMPLGATEDMVIGSVDIEKALKEGIKALQPGVLAEVNRGILYIDEVNLLDDHLVDVLLDSAAMGVNTIEREGVSVSHPSKFILVGTMNPEEGELRPQLLDRFGLQVEITGSDDVDERIQIVKTVEAFEKGPQEFIKKYKEKQDKIKNDIVYAKSFLDNVEISDKFLKKIAKLCIELGVDGHRADILIARTAKTIAAYNKRKKVEENDVKEAADLVLPHRMRRQPFQEQKPIHDKIEQMMGEDEEDKDRDKEDKGANGEDRNGGKEEKRQKKQEKQRGESDNKRDENNETDGQQQEEQGKEKENDNEVEQQPHPESKQEGEDENKGNRAKTFNIGNSKKPEINIEKDRKIRIGSGRRAKTLSTKSGKYVKAKIPQEKTSDIAIDATIRASAMRNLNKKGMDKGNILMIEKDDLREKVRERKKATAIVFVVDSSGSMAAKRRMEAAKGAVMSLLEDAYQKRDKVGFVAFKGNKAEILLNPTTSITLAARYLKNLPTGGRTPLPDGIYKGLELLKKEKSKDKNVIPMMVLVSDGKGNVPINKNVKQEVISLAYEVKEKGINLVVIDSGHGLLKLGYNKEIVEVSGGKYYNLGKVNADNITNIVKSNLS